MMFELFDFPCIFCEEIEVLQLKIKGIFYLVCFVLHHSIFFGTKSVIVKRSDFMLSFMVFSNFEIFVKGK